MCDTVENRSVNIQTRLKQDFQMVAGGITKKFTELMEAEIKHESVKNHEELIKHHESTEWNFRFEAPSDDHYADGGAPGAVSVLESAAEPARIITTTNHTRSTSEVEPLTTNEMQISETGSAPASAVSLGPGPPPRGTAEYEAFWTTFRITGANLPPISLVKEALDINGETWEELRQVATIMIEENDLVELRWKDILADHPALIQTFMGLHMHLLTEIKSSAFMELLCELTFHSARRGILERGRRKQHRQKVKEDVPAPSDPRLKIREARQAKVQDDIVFDNGLNTAIRTHEARLANLEEQSGRLQALKASTTAANRQAGTMESARSGRANAVEYFEGDVGYTPSKRSLSPSEDRRGDLSKKIKLEPLSQDDALSIVADPVMGQSSTVGTFPGNSDYVSLN